MIRHVKFGGRHPAGWRLLFLIGMTVLVSRAVAQISVTSAGVTAHFYSVPPFAEWAAVSVGSDNGAGVVTTAADLDARVQELSIAAVSNTLPTTAGWPPAQFNHARWNSTARLIHSRPGNNWYAALVGKFRNDSGRPLQTLGISFDLLGGLVSPETLPGFRVYRSLSGDVNSWVLLSPLSTGSTGRISAAISLLPEVWQPGTSLFLLWADDNGPSSDGYYALDNVSLALQPTLRVGRVTESEVEVSWPAGWGDCELEWATAITGAAWETAPGAPACENDTCRQRFSITAQWFFRLCCSPVVP